ncbi:UNVERIFIED_ORG: hypothetical protein B2H98_14315 [Clostridium botulinum]
MIDINYEKIHCPVCENNDIDNIFESEINEVILHGIIKVKVNIGICKKCGLVFQNPVPDETSLNEYYKLQSDTIEQSDDIRSEYYEIYTYIKNNTNYELINKVLDIGCRRGEMLKLFKNDNKHILGIEPSECNVKYLNEVLIPVIKGTFNNQVVKNKQFNLIMLINVLEHIKNPGKIVTEIYNKLTSNGYLFISVPNFDKCINDKNINNISNYFGFQHLQYFTLDTLVSLLQKSGFNIIKYDIKDSSINVICNVSNDIKLEFKNQYERNKEMLTEFLNGRKQKLANLVYILKNLNSNGLVIYGAGAHTTQLMQIMNFDKLNLVGICDSDENKYGMSLGGFKVCNINELDASKFNDILISSNAYQDEIYKYLIGKFPGKNIIKLY